MGAHVAAPTSQSPGDRRHAGGAVAQLTRSRLDASVFARIRGGSRARS